MNRLKPLISVKPMANRAICASALMAVVAAQIDAGSAISTTNSIATATGSYTHESGKTGAPYVDPGVKDSPRTSTPNAEGPKPIKVALYKGPGTGGKGPPRLMKKLNNAPTSTIVQLSPEAIAGGALTNFDVVIFGGGSGSRQAGSIGEAGREAVRKFVADGGGYVGICAGAYLATSGFSWSLGLVNARTVSPKWQRGIAPVKVELTESGTQVLGERKGQFDCLYANGPIVAPDSRTNLPSFETLAWFRTEVSSNNAPVGVMIDSPAMFSGQFHRGRVVCVSPHPEQTEGLEEMIPDLVNWVAPRAPATANKLPSRAE